MTKFAIGALAALLLSDLWLGFKTGWADLNPLVSIALHGLGGFFVAMLIFSFYHSQFRKLSQFLQVLAVLGMTMGVGLIWEFAEYIGGRLLAGPIYDAFQVRVYFMGDLSDTVGDLFMDTVGAIAFLGLYFLKNSNSKKP